MTQQIEALPQTQSLTSTPVVDRPAKRAPGRGRGRPGTTESKVYRKVTSHHPPREEMKKKKGFNSVFMNYHVLFKNQCTFYTLPMSQICLSAVLLTEVLHVGIILSLLFASRHEEG